MRQGSPLALGICARQFKVARIVDDNLMCAIVHVDIRTVHYNIVPVTKQNGDLLNWNALCFGDEPPGQKCTNETEDNEEKVKFPSNVSVVISD